MIFKFNGSLFHIPYHEDDTLRKVAILEFIWPSKRPVVLPGDILYLPEGWQRDNLVQRDYAHYVSFNQTILKQLLAQITPL